MHNHRFADGSGISAKLQGDLYVRCDVHRSSGGIGNRRGTISAFSERSKRSLRRYCRTCVSEYRVLLTLTWPSQSVPDGGGQAEFRAFCERLRRWQEKNNIVAPSLLWVREFTKNGTPHYHCLLTHRLPLEWVSSAWYGACGKISANHLRAGTRIESIRSKNPRRAVAAYLSKYLSKHTTKQYQHRLPERLAAGAGRWWGVAGRRDCQEAAAHVSWHGACSKTAAEGLESLQTWLKSEENAAEVVVIADKPGVSVMILKTARLRRVVERAFERVKQLNEESREIARFERRDRYNGRGATLHPAIPYWMRPDVRKNEVTVYAGPRY